MLRSLIRRHALPLSTQIRRVLFSTGTSASSSGTTASPDPHFMVEYLMNTCGFSADDSSKASKLLPRSIQSTENADAVLGFFRSQGLDGANLRRIIAWKPGLLGWDVETKLAPKFNFLRDLGFSQSDAVNVVILHPIILSLNVQNTLLPKLKVWESLFGSREILLYNLRRCKRFMSNSIENVVRPNLNFLRDECGIPEERVSLVVRRHPSFIVQNPAALRALVDRADGIGILRESKMFLWILSVLHGVSREKFEAQVKLMNCFGKDGIFGQGCWDCTFRHCSPPGAFGIKFGKESLVHYCLFLHLGGVYFCTGTSASSASATASPDPQSMVKYLMSTCVNNVSSENPDVVHGFLRSQGLDGANLREVISWSPGLLGWDVEKNLTPKFQFLREMGLSESEVIDVILLHPTIVGLNFQHTSSSTKGLGKSIWIEGDPPQESPHVWMVFEQQH
ncbi:hypothetical protein ZIOFF_056950 [Zingiber officinale]|uniref:Mitochondrial transcription termination factor family protein n=1 Tax=Zingiber officinale TaxID=94328 RepID=A0A8J5FIS5_ZINOF|nr:hypothetical protein ZIOFF_056950 [Zingiber officinale]